jgi:opacity protein-like surface antigen
MKRAAIIVAAAAIALPAAANAADVGTLEWYKEQNTQLQLSLDQKDAEIAQWQTNYDVADSMYRDTVEGCAIAIGKRDAQIASTRAGLRKQRALVRRLVTIIHILRRSLAG